MLFLHSFSVQIKNFWYVLLMFDRFVSNLVFSTILSWISCKVSIKDTSASSVNVCRLILFLLIQEQLHVFLIPTIGDDDQNSWKSSLGALEILSKFYCHCYCEVKITLDKHLGQGFWDTYVAYIHFVYISIYLRRYTRRPSFWTQHGVTSSIRKFIVLLYLR